MSSESSNSSHLAFNGLEPTSLKILGEKYSQLLSWIQGPEEQKITGLNAGSKASKEQLVFISDAEHLESATRGASQAWVVNKKMLREAQAAASKSVSLFLSPNPQLLMALIARDIFPLTIHKRPFEGENIHSSAVVASSATIGKNVIIGPNTTIGENCVIGDNCIIGSNVTIEPHCRIGASTHIHPQVFIGHSTEMGEKCEVHPQTSIGTEGYGYAQDEKGNHYRITHYGRVIFEDDVHIGAGVQIDRGTFEDSRIGQGTKIDNHCHFGHNIKIGKNTLITGGMITAGSVSIGSQCVFGGRTSVSGHLSIADRVQVAGLSGVTKTIEKSGAYGGYPLQPLKRALKTTATLASLPEMRKNLSQVLKALNLKEIVSPNSTDSN